MERSKTILIIENDPEMANAMSVALGRSGREVVASPDGVDGLEKGSRLDPDLVILDMLLPGMDGLEVARRLNMAKDGLSPAILMVSSKARKTDQYAARQAGAASLLSKPLNFDEFAVAAEGLLATAGNTPEYVQVQTGG
jgi:DNA-binding response OmpR family regulator